MKKYFKVFIAIGVVVVLLVLAFIINYVRNSVIMDDLTSLGYRTIGDFSNAKIISKSTINGEVIDETEVSKDFLVFKEQNTGIKAFTIIRREDTYYKIKVGASFYYVNRENGLVEKIECPDMNSIVYVDVQEVQE